MLTYNTYYVLLPELSDHFRSFNKASWKPKIIVAIPIVPLSCAIIFFGFCMQVVTIIFRVKIRNAVIKSLEVLSKMNI
jgi:hypothetical protein